MPDFGKRQFRFSSIRDPVPRRQTRLREDAKGRKEFLACLGTDAYSDIDRVGPVSVGRSASQPRRERKRERERERERASLGYLPKQSVSRRVGFSSPSPSSSSSVSKESLGNGSSAAAEGFGTEVGADLCDTHAATRITHSHAHNICPPPRLPRPPLRLAS